MAEIREVFMAGDRRYEIRLQGKEWYELWCDGTMIGVRNEWPVDPETEMPYIGSKFLEATEEMCIAAAKGIGQVEQA